ncbi:MAG: GatB/YqeY domain-containing protein [Bacteroidota bacterium]|nr:GatB/YqeY domain-containing protein [Bacteroidota bacterium]
MNVKETILADLVTAIKAKDPKRLQVLRSLKAKLLEKEIEQRSGGKAELTNEEALTVLTKAAKQRKESIDQYSAGNRLDLVEIEKLELEIIESYLPAPMSNEEILKLIDIQITNVGATGMQDIGKVMGPIMGKLKGRADGSIVNRLVKERLGS